jgi:hypothetical protein
MKPDIYTKAVLTVIAIMLAVIACKPLISPDTTASAQGSFAGIQYAGGGQFFDTRTGEIWVYTAEQLIVKQRLAKLGQPLVRESSAYDKK